MLRLTHFHCQIHAFSDDEAAGKPNPLHGPTVNLMALPGECNLCWKKATFLYCVSLFSLCKFISMLGIRTGIAHANRPQTTDLDMRRGSRWLFCFLRLSLTRPPGLTLHLFGPWWTTLFVSSGLTLYSLFGPWWTTLFVSSQYDPENRDINTT